MAFVVVVVVVRVGVRTVTSSRGGSGISRPSSRVVVTVVIVVPCRSHLFFRSRGGKISEPAAYNAFVASLAKWGTNWLVAPRRRRRYCIPSRPSLVISS